MVRAHIATRAAVFAKREQFCPCDVKLLYAVGTIVQLFLLRVTAHCLAVSESQNLQRFPRCHQWPSEQAGSIMFLVPASSWLVGTSLLKCSRSAGCDLMMLYSCDSTEHLVNDLASSRSLGPLIPCDNPAAHRDSDLERWLDTWISRIKCA